MEKSVNRWQLFFTLVPTILALIGAVINFNVGQANLKQEVKFNYTELTSDIEDLKTADEEQKQNWKEFDKKLDAILIKLENKKDRE